MGGEVMSIGWRQTPSAHALIVVDGGIGAGLPDAVGVDASMVEPWRDVIGSRLDGVRGLVNDETGLPLILQLAFGSNRIAIAAATYLFDEGVILPGVDEILVFNPGVDPITWTPDRKIRRTT